MDRVFDVEVEGIAPILFNRFTDQAAAQVDAGGRGKKKTKAERIKEAHKLIYTDAKGFMVIPAVNVKKSLLEGCGMAGIKIGRRGAITFMRPTVFIVGDHVYFLTKGKKRKKPDGIHECSGRRPPRTGGRCIVRRPYLNAGWTAKFQFVAYDDRLTGDMIKQALVESGMLCGWCDHRPEFGRFKVVKFELKG